MTKNYKNYAVKHDPVEQCSIDHETEDYYKYYLVDHEYQSVIHYSGNYDYDSVDHDTVDHETVEHETNGMVEHYTNVTVDDYHDTNGTVDHDTNGTVEH